MKAARSSLLPLAKARLRLFPASPGRRALLLFLAVLALSGLMGGNHLLKGRVISVPDGDTLVLYLSAGGTERVRLYGVDSPELSQAGGEESSAFLRSLALYKKVDMDVRYKDPYGRSVAVVRLDDGRVLNEELLRHGQTWLYTRYCDAPQCTAWKKLEREAKQARLGLWQDAAPTPPWKWRGALRPKNSRNNQRTPERI